MALEIPQIIPNTIYEAGPKNDPGWYRDENGRVWIRCICGTFLFIAPRTDGWTIDAEGQVMPSVDCRPHGCDWHVHLKLLGWHGGVLGRA